ncbi:MAG: hypothetical protein VX899_14620 [Myxococcota bacterium]|nr:hypothetical protein [Myxococcota bacterium]
MASALGGCVDYNLCAWEQVPFAGESWAGQTPEQWAEAYLGSWTVEPTWTWHEEQPPVGVAEVFQIDLSRGGQPAVEQIKEAGYCDQTPKLRVLLAGSVQSLDGGIQAVHSGSESDWAVVVREDGLAWLELTARTDAGSLRWEDSLFEGDPADGVSYQVFVRGDELGGRLSLQRSIRNKEIHKGSVIWGPGKWAW